MKKGKDVVTDPIDNFPMKPVKYSDPFVDSPFKMQKSETEKNTISMDKQEKITTTSSKKVSKIVPTESDNDPKIVQKIPPVEKKFSDHVDKYVATKVTKPPLVGIPIPKDKKGRATLAFPSLATTSHNFDPKMATKILLKVVYGFLGEHPMEKLKFMLVEKKGAPVLEYLSKYMDNNEPRFGTIVGKELFLTKLQTAAQKPACYIVNEANWRMKEGGTEINKLIHLAAGPHFSATTKSHYNTGAVGGAYSVPLSADSRLFHEEGVFWVIHVVPPNLNPKYPDVIGDVEEAGKVLEKAYRNMVECFYELWKKK